MATPSITIRQSRHTIVEGSSLKFQVITRITAVTDPNPSSPWKFSLGTALVPPLFLLKKTGTTASEYMYSSNISYMRFASPEDFRVTSPFDPTKTELTTWNTLVAATKEATYVVPAQEIDYQNSTIANANTSTNGYFTSAVLVRRFNNLKDADDHAEDVQTAIENFQSNYNTIMDSFTTMDDATAYPSGWAAYSYS